MGTYISNFINDLGWPFGGLGKEYGDEWGAYAGGFSRRVFDTTCTISVGGRHQGRKQAAEFAAAIEKAYYTETDHAYDFLFGMYERMKDKMWFRVGNLLAEKFYFFGNKPESMLCEYKNPTFKFFISFCMMTQGHDYGVSLK